MSKKELGQFYTTNYKYILSGMSIPPGTSIIIEPFVGDGSCLKFLDNCMYDIEAYDIDPKYPGAVRRDTLMDPPDYRGKFVLTNPPYLARNKSKNKSIYDKYKLNDLYKCFLKSIIDNPCKNGIIIIPLNFLSSIRKSDVELRRDFLNRYSIVKINIFEERVFDDTNYSICSIQFDTRSDTKEFDCFVYPSKKNIKLCLDSSNNYTIGGEIYTLPVSGRYKIERATNKTNNESMSNILLKCIDDSSKLCLRLVSDEDRYVDNTPKLSARSYATLVITPSLDKEKQKELVEKFNEFITEQRSKYNSLFLTNYRESNRKRISFDLAFRICGHLLID